MQTNEEKKLNLIAVKIAHQLDGLTMAQALSVVERKVPAFLKNGHVVDCSNSAATALKSIVESDRGASL